MAIRTTAEREGALPYIIGGLAGVPVGVAILRTLPANIFAAGLLIYALHKRRRKTVFLAKKDSDFFHREMSTDYADLR